MNYKIITDSDKLKEFIEWLPELKMGEGYYVALFGRSKYAKGIMEMNADKQQIKRFVSNKDYLYDKIKQLEVEIGCYKHKGAGMPQEALALYITPNPRNYLEAIQKTSNQFSKLITTPYNGFNPQAEVMSNIQTSCGKRIYTDFDFDGLSFEEGKLIIEQYINPDCLTYVQTRGGFHLLVELSKIKKEFVKNWYINITKLPGCDVRGDNLLPVPGTYQGGFTPKLIING